MVEARQAIGLQHRALLRHLVPLIDDGHIFAASDNGRRVFLLPHGQGIETWWPQVVVLRDLAAARMHAGILAQESVTHASITANAMNVGLSRGCARSRLQELVNSQLVERERRDSATRTTRYCARPINPYVLQFLESSRHDGHVQVVAAHHAEIDR